MKKNFWKKLKKPFFCLAPMADVTDSAFRQIINKYGKPDVTWTEFVSADGLANKKGKKKLLIDLKFSKKEHPIVAQIFSANELNIKKAAALCQKLGYDGVDINMGCPDRSVEKQGAGSALIKNIEQARKVIRAAKKGAPNLPISIKTRIGYNKNEIETWLRGILEEDLAAISIHMRTRKELSNGPAHWDLMKRIVEIKNEVNRNTLIIGNGDVLSIKEAKEKVKEYKCDGVMLGRAVFGNPWLFNKKVSKHSTEEKLKVLVEHTKLFQKIIGKHKNFAVMKKHYKAYVNGFEGAKELRAKLMETNNAKEVEEIIKNFLKNKTF